MIKKRYILIVTGLMLVITFKITTKSSTDVLANTINDKQVEDSNNGRKYLEQLESKDVYQVENKIKESTKVVTKNNVKTKKVDLKKYYENTVFMGDSLTEYMSEAEILPKYNVYGKKGKTVLGTKDDVEKIKNVKPERVIMLFGMNDVSSFQNAEDFKKAYLKLIDQVKLSKQTKIYIESPTPVQAKAENTEEGMNNEKITKFKQAVKEVAEESHVNYVDITGLVKDNYYEPDGVHFKYDFYSVWLNYLKDIIEEKE